MSEYQKLVDEAVPRVPPRTAAALLDVMDSLRASALGFPRVEKWEDVSNWPDADKLRVIALHLYIDDWKNGVYDEDDMQRDLLRIAHRLERDDQRTH